MDDTIILTVFDKDLIFDDLIGHVIMRVGSLISMSNEATSMEVKDALIPLAIYNKIQKAGDLNVTVSFESFAKPIIVKKPTVVESIPKQPQQPPPKNQVSKSIKNQQQLINMTQVEEEADEDEFKKVTTEDVDDSYFEFSPISSEKKTKSGTQ